MDLRSTHHGYAYQDLITGIALVDLVLGTTESLAVDTKGFEGDRFDDLTIGYQTGKRVRIQIKHTTQDRELSKDSFSADGRSLRIDLLFTSLLSDLGRHPGTEYRVVVRDGRPDVQLAEVLEPTNAANDPGDPLPGLSTVRFKFNPTALQAKSPWQKKLSTFTTQEIHAACERLTIDTSAPASTIDFSAPGPAERVLLWRVTEELGAGRTPNTHVSPDYVALALTHAATGSRALDGHVSREHVLPQVGLATDFGAVAEGHPVEAAVVVPRADASAEVRQQVDVVAPNGGRVVVTGEPGAGKSWLCEQLAGTYRDEGWVVARHHCWLGATDTSREQRVLADVVIGSLLRQLEQHVPEATADLRPRFAATPEALTSALQKCRESRPSQSVLLIIDGLDHVDRVLGKSAGQRADPSLHLVDQLAAIDLPAGVCVLIASQPGSHLAGARPSSGVPVKMPRMSWSEMRVLAIKHDLFTDSTGVGPLGESEQAVVDLLHERSGGNALYATYLCRYASRTSPLDDRESGTVQDVLHRLKRVPDTATDVDTYYEYLLSTVTGDQMLAIGTLALCDFALSASELGELLPPIVKPLLEPALKTLAPVLTSLPGLGGLRVHHESFSRYILRDKDIAWVTSVREHAAVWLTDRGFFADARAFRHLPELLAQLGRYDELKALVEPGFVAEGIRAFQPPEALQRVVGTVSRESEARLDWPTLITCVETRKAIDTYELDSLANSISEYSDVVVAIVGADVVAERLVYEGRPTLSEEWGLRLCAAVDRAGAAAPWKAYLDARESDPSRRRAAGSDHDGAVHLAVQLGELRLRSQRGDIPPDLAEQVAANLELDHKATLENLVEVFTAGLPTGAMPDVAAAMTDTDKAAQVYLTLADLAAAGTPGLPDPAHLARQAWALAPSLNLVAYLKYGISPADVLAGLGTTDLEADIEAATSAVLAGPSVDHRAVERWLSLLTLAHGLDRTTPIRHVARLGGVGFYRAWLRYAVATLGIADDVAAGVTTAETASTAVLVALADLAAEAHPFTGDPRACDLYSIHPLVHQVVEKSLVVIRPKDLDAVLVHLVEIADGTTTTTNFGLPENGPLATNDLLAILARVSDHIGVGAVYALLKVVRARRRDSHTQYSVTANFELATARICLAAGAFDEVDECWRRASLLLGSYGGHKDPTLSEIIDSLDDLADVNVLTAQACLGKLVDLVYLVRQHTNGRGTSHFVNQWWEKAAAIDPTAAATDAADVLLSEIGFDDVRAHTAHVELLTSLIMTADPMVLAALRLTLGTEWRFPETDLHLLIRLRSELGKTNQSDTMLAIVANNITATYDDQPMLYSSDQSKSVVSSELVDAAVHLGGSAFAPRVPRREQTRNSMDWSPGPKADPLQLQKRLVNAQRPFVPEGRTGALLAARELKSQRYGGDTATRWDLDTATNIIGWRIIESTLVHGQRFGIELLDDVAQELGWYRDNKVFAEIGEGIAMRCGDNDALQTVASYCLTLAYVHIRGGGGWRAFAGRERADLWRRAYELDSDTAQRTLAAAVVQTVRSDAQSTYGVTQAVIAAFAATRDDTATECWEAAFTMQQHRLPGTAERGGHTYRPTENPPSQQAKDVALTTLALATIARPQRQELRRTLIAVALLVTCRPPLAQTALISVLRSDLDAGRATWLLDIVHTYLPIGALTAEMAAEMTLLARDERLSVRALASQILDVQGHPVPHPPATEPEPKIRAVHRHTPGARE
ncbi:ATP-binding protein [Lentzea sp. BCCO 10_0856]|uniref:ATP-binding protein n=1 Tax=Lentzea miocenica TaxID=3095431 RepID=A0ABU4T0R0_9PSEU|nr:ATP-binding protein [Lentzea sp. BCCO 10_0856]MDX8031747.1 ATP-binding protein [Lentzea sp. BCCO 10_0856]